MNDMKKSLKASNGITLIALVITIIVLLILAAISLTMLTGDNSILKRAVDAKEQTERAEIEEALRLAYIDLVGNDWLNYSTTASLDEAVTIVQNQGYKDKIKGISGGAYKLSSENIILSTTGEESDKTQTIKLEEDTSTSLGGTWYALINGKYFKIEENNGDIKIAKEPSNVDPNSQGDTINITSSDVTIAKENDKVIATFEVTDVDTVKVTASNEGTSTITISANGKKYTGNLKVVNKIEQAPANLDGALELLAATDTSNQNGANVTLQNIEMTTSNPDVATVTTEGIVKCNKVDGGAEAIISAKQGETTRYFKVKSTAKIATSKGEGAPAVPEGFTAIDTADAKWSTQTAETNKGLVIMDEKGNQFVWVPVSSLNSMFMCKKHSSTSDCNIRLTTDGKGIECGSEAHKDTNGNYCTEIVGKLYATTTGESFGTVNQTYTEDRGLREPDKLKSTGSGDWSTTADRGLNLIKSYVKGFSSYDLNNTTDVTNLKNKWTKQLKDEFYNMALSVAKNGGFYVGRYESSLINGETRVVAGAASMSVKTDSAGTWYGLYQKQKDFISTGHLNSTMIWGSQYDAIMNWIANGDNTKIKDNSVTNKNSDGARRTGSKATDKINNIFDLYGLRCEWTMEAYDTNYRVRRGGYCSDSWSPSYRDDINPYNTYDTCSSRPTLYIQ